MNYESTKIIELGSCAFRQWRADSHCKYIHGYRLIAKFWFACDKLDERNWVVDFGGLKELKQVLEGQFDHTLCLASDDPLLEHFKALHHAGAVDLRIMEKGVGIERTAEWCFDVADSHVRGITKNRCWVDRVEVWEHDKNSAIVYFAKPAKEDVTVIGRYSAEQYELPFDKNETISTTIQPNLQMSTTVAAGINIDNANITPVDAPVDPNASRPAPVGNQKSVITQSNTKPDHAAPARVGKAPVTQGWSNPFAGTSWGA
jgi:6-pyruvoyltetrahydropterin/6-carboxytetrahydropterin synthase